MNLKILKQIYNFMKFLIVAFLVVFLLVNAQLTVPLEISFGREQLLSAHHLRKAQFKKQTYKLMHHETVFNIKLKVFGLIYNLVVDTGSADFIIKGHGSNGSPSVKYSCEKCRNQNKNYKVSYSDGLFEAYAKDADIQLGNYKFNQNILVAYSSPRAVDFIDGILGLSYQKIAQNPAPTFLNTLIQKKIIQHYSFGVKLNFIKKRNSYITFGGYNQNYIAKDQSFAYYKFRQHEFFIPVKGVKLNSGQLMPFSTGLLDTGNTCISIYQKYEKQILQKFNVGGNNCEFKIEYSNPDFKKLECYVKDFNKLPVLQIVTDQKIFLISKEYYLQNCSYNRWRSHHFCNLILQTTRSNILILGGTFFLRYYGYFDLQNHQVGLIKNNANITLQDILRQ